MSLRSAPGRAKPGYPPSDPLAGPLVHPHRKARRRALERAYPLAKQLAEILELEAIEPMASSAKHIRQAVGAELAELGRGAIEQPFAMMTVTAADS